MITAWGRSKGKDGAAKAQALFDDMLARHKSGDIDLRPGVVEYTALIDAWARAGAPERAEQILRDMDSSGNVGVKPNVISYTAVMNAWSRSGKSDAAHRTQALFNELMQKFEAGERAKKPDLHTFGTLITAWGRSKHTNSAYQAQAVFDKLLWFYRSGDQDLKPNVVICTAVIDAWARAGVPDKAEQMLRQMESETSWGAKPDLIAYNAVLTGWSYHFDRVQATGRMQVIYDEVKEKYLGGDTKVKPNARIFVTLLTTWRRTVRKGGMLKAEAIFKDMHDCYKSGEAELKPLVETYGPMFQ
jgi:pentatricopeptide repeat protein